MNTKNGAVLIPPKWQIACEFGLKVLEVSFLYAICIA
jgi:hypothetical protein